MIYFKKLSEKFLLNIRYDSRDMCLKKVIDGYNIVCLIEMFHEVYYWLKIEYFGGFEHFSQLWLTLSLNLCYLKLLLVNQI